MTSTAKRVVRIVAISLTLLLGIWFMMAWLVSQALMHGERHTGLDNQIARELLDSAAAGLERFRARHGHYPQVEGKYFFDSIKAFVSVHEAYVFADSVSAGGIAIRIRGHFNYLHSNHVYLGAGSAERTIMYHIRSSTSYKLYDVGENALDEDGRGDDIEY